MTRVTYRRYYDRFLVIIEGHSGFDIKGSDIVCSAISILAFTLMESLEDEQSDKRLILRRKVLRDGYFCIEAEPFEFSEKRVEAIFETCMLGLSLIAEQYPDYIRME